MHLSRVMVICLLAEKAFCQVDYYLKPVAVTASRMTQVLASETRERQVLDSTTIREIPAQSIPDVLQSAGVDIARRGTNAQADFSLRGSSFEQVLVLVDGVRMNDPQTGHFISDFPVALQDIDRIEILSGQASSPFGPEGFGGVIQIHTRIPERTQTRMHLQTGSLGTVGGWLGQSFRLGHWRHNISFGREKSDGYRQETGLNAWTANWRSNYRNHGVDWSTSALIGRRDFGANGFYAPYPSHEKTGMNIVQTAFGWQVTGKTRIRGQVSGKQHDDDFILDVNRPAWYRNKHRSTSLGAEFQVNHIMSDRLETVAGADWCREVLSSARLGDHDRQRVAIFGEAAWRGWKGILVDGGIRADHLDRIGFQISPSLGVAVPIQPGFRWRASAGHIFRQPTFTELYYDSPSNIGDPSIKPESGQSVETGLSFSRGHLMLDGTLFGRHEINPIDWIETSPAVWEVHNLKNRTLYGAAIRFGWRIASWEFQGFYQEIEHSEDTNIQSAKYGANVTRRLLTASVGWSWPFQIKQQIVFKYRKRRALPDLSLMDIRFSRSWRYCTLHLSILNVFDQIVEEVPGVPLPGRYGLFQAEIVL